jgi:hypothetical protein
VKSIGDVRVSLLDFKLGLRMLARYVAGIRAGRDEVLEEGIRQILGRQTPQDRIERMVRP